MYKDYAVFDLEIKYGIPINIKNEYTYCKGWTDYIGMGCSCGAVTYLEETIVYSDIDKLVNRLIKLQESNIYVGGFNNKTFDDKLLAGLGYNFISDFDLLKFIRERIGFIKGLSLSALAEKNGLTKLGHGSSAPELFQDGKFEELYTYVKNDSYITYELLKKMLDNSFKW